MRLTSELLVKLNDQVSGPAGKMSGALKKATSDLGKIDIYKGQAKRLDELAEAHQRAREKVRGLAQQLIAADSPSKSLQASYARATAAVDKLGNKLDWQRARVRGAAQEVGAMGIAVNNLAAGELQLRANIERATAAMRRQEAAAQRSAVRRQALGTVAAGVGVVAAHKGLQIGKDAVSGAGKIDYALRHQQFATGLSGAEQDRVLYPQAKRIGQDTKFTNEDVVQAQTTFANGLPAAMKQSGVIKSVIDQVKNYALTVKGVDMDQAAMAVKGYLLSLGKDISTPEKAETEARGASNRLIRATKIGGLTHDDLKRAGLKGIKIDETLGAIRRDYWAAGGRSFLHLGQSLAEELGATFKLRGDRAALVRRGDGRSASGSELPTIMAVWGDNLMSWDISPNLGRPQHATARLRWFDRKDARFKELDVEVKSGDGAPEAMDVGRFEAADEQSAKDGAEGKKTKADRDGGGGTVRIDCDPLAQAEGTLVLVGADPGVDGTYRIDSVRHSLTRSGGADTNCSVKQPSGTAGKDSRKAAQGKE